MAEISREAGKSVGISGARRRLSLGAGGAPRPHRL